MQSSYKSDDVIILLKDITGLIEPIGTKEREKYIQGGVHYSEMLPIEYEPSEKYMEAYKDALVRFAEITALSVASVADRIYGEKRGEVTLVSLARAGTSIGILIKRFIERKYKIKVHHYTISIIRGKGIDENALNYILERHSASSVQFVDGWTGKGAIQNELNSSVKKYKGLNPGLAVLSDPAYAADKCGTHNDFLIASSCLNSTVCGLLSRTFLRDDIIGENDFHGAVYYENLKTRDVTYEFIDAIEKKFCFDKIFFEEEAEWHSGLREAEEIARHFEIDDINFVKPGIGETTRVLLRRVPWKILVSDFDGDEYLGHIYQLAKEKNVPMEQYPLKNYRACGLIRRLADN